jgi:hypothetical protein
MGTPRPLTTASTRISVTPLDPPLRPLCPSCRSTVVRVAATAALVFDVVGADGTGEDADLEVMAHEWQDASWERGSAASCPSCAWTGRVEDLLAGDA